MSTKSAGNEKYACTFLPLIKCLCNIICYSHFVSNIPLAGKDVGSL